MGISSSSGSGSSGSDSSSSGTKKGKEWTYKIYFEPEAAASSGTTYDFNDTELISNLKNLVDVNEDIINISAYKQNLWPWQVTQFFFYHMFILFETNDWWWSIEKNSKGITLQRSRNQWVVKENYRRSQRNKINIVKKYLGSKSMMDLILWLYSENELNKKYNYLTSNCKHFAKAVFDHVAPNKEILSIELVQMTKSQPLLIKSVEHDEFMVFSSLNSINSTYEMQYKTSGLFKSFSQDSSFIFDLNLVSPVHLITFR